MTRQIAYLGPEGTFTEAAALIYDSTATLLPYPTITSVATSVDNGNANLGIVPIENSLEGYVTDTLYLLIHYTDLQIVNEIVIPIEHCLLMKERVPNQYIQIVYSHPQALGQCRNFLENNFPSAQIVAALSTAPSVEEMLNCNSPAAAIATRRAARIYGATIVSEGIQDNLNNTTRFVILAKEDHEFTGNDKTSICFSFGEDKPGILYMVMGEFASRNINLAKVESRPNKETLGRYIFLMDLEGHRTETHLSEALNKVRENTSFMKILGSYPHYSPK